ncbi:MAG TPA: hypothetical protein VIM79_24580 [Niastella sp.]
MEILDMYARSYGNMDQREEWKTFFQTRDWYDMPDNINENESHYLYTERESKNRTGFGRRYYILPIDLEYIYDFSSVDARSLLNEIREVLDIPISGPVTYPDFEQYTKLDLETIFDFLRES